MSRVLDAVAAVGVLFVFTPLASGEHGNLASVASIAAALTVAILVACLDHRMTASARRVVAAGPVSDERHRRGAFRRLSSPDTPGRPRPRAPGAGYSPA